EVLVAADGGVVSAEELLARGWDENADPFTNAVRITVSGLRKRLGEPWIIATVAGVGYRIAGGERGESAGVERSPQAHPQLRRLPHARGRLAARGGVAVLGSCDPRRARPRARLPPRRPARIRSDRGRRAGVPARIRSAWRVASRRPHARPAHPHHRRHTHGR